MNRKINLPQWIFWLAPVVLAAAALLGVLIYRRQRARQELKRIVYSQPPDLSEVEGLTEAEAAARRTTASSEERQRIQKETRNKLIRENVISIFNLSLLGLAAATMLMGDIWGGLITLGVMFLNIGLNVFQQLRSARRVEEISIQSQPAATVIRDSQLKSIDQTEIVLDDVLVTGIGDQFLVDGKLLQAKNLVVDESAFSPTSKSVHKQIGELVKAGSLCTQGWSVYTAKSQPSDLPGESSLHTIPGTRAELTPLQRIIDQVLRGLLLLVVIFLIMLVVDFIHQDLIPTEVQSLYRDLVSIIFSIAPSGLFFMIVVAYAVGAADLVREGALVRSSSAVESLAQVNVLCFGKSGTLTGTEAQIEPIKLENGPAPMSTSRLRQILGDFTHSTSDAYTYVRLLANSFQGERRGINQEFPYLSAYGWSGITFSDPDLRGTYVIGLPEVLQSTLIVSTDATDDTPKDETDQSLFNRTIGRVGGLFRRDPKKKQNHLSDSNEDSPSPASKPQDVIPTSTEEENHSENSTGKNNFLRRMQNRIKRIVRRSEPEHEDEDTPQEATSDSIRFLLAYSPEPQSFIHDDGKPRIPDGLIPLCDISFVEQLRPEARTAIKTFSETGVQVKILSTGDQDSTLNAARQLGLGGPAPKAVSGHELSQMDNRTITKAVKEASVISPITTQQKADLIRIMRANNEHVAMVGDGLNDVPAMQEANLSIALQGSTQAAIGQADIILLKDSLTALPTVLGHGQRVVNGLLDILKLNLTQIGYVVLLLIAILFTGKGIFFYDPTQSGVISFFTIVVPSLALTLWASKGSIPAGGMRRRLIHFVLPAAFSTAIAAVSISLIFLQFKVSPGDIQLAVTYGLISIGLLLVLFVQPPSRFWVGGDVYAGDKRFTIVVIASFLLYIVATFIPLAQELLKIAPFSEPVAYAIIFAISLLWMMTIRAVWRSRWMR